MGICCEIENKDRIIPLEDIIFPSGEHYYQLIKDYNRSNIINKFDNLSERVELFFSLIDIKNINEKYSLRVSIINNKRIGNESFLGDLKKGIKEGNDFIFDNSFEVDFFFEREQIVIIEPLINGNETGQKNKFILCNLMTSREGKLNINIENVGMLQINQKKIEKEKELQTEISCFQFFITLDNDIFKNSKNLENIFYVIRNIKDGEKRRPVYKSHEYDFELNKEKQTSWINLDSELLCNNDDMEIFFELYSPSIKKMNI